VSEFDVFARFYDFDHGDYADDVQLYLNFARHTGPPVLEAACGTGRLLVPLARAGLPVTGLDVSPAMLAIAAEQAKKNGVEDLVRLVNADMRDFRLDERFELAFIALNSFCHLASGEDQVTALACLRNHLNDEGLLIIDLFNPDYSYLADAAGQVIHDYTRVDPTTGHTIVKFTSTRHDPSRQLLDVTFFYDELLADGQLKRTIAPFVRRYFFRSEMELLLEKTGFQIENIYGSYDLADFEAESPKMIFVARKV
jgi:SAM-dependent methyltransferase